MRAESVSALRERVRVELAETEAAAKRPGPSPAELEATANEAKAAARAAAHTHDDLAERAAIAKERLAALERSLAEREGIAPAARMLAEEGAELALSLLDVAPGSERAVAAALGRGASAVVAEDAAAGLTLLRRARDAGLGSLAVLVGKRPRNASPSCPSSARPAARGDGSVSDRRGIRVRPAARGALVRAARPRRPSCSSWRRGGGSSRARSRSCKRRPASLQSPPRRPPRPPSGGGRVRAGGASTRRARRRSQHSAPRLLWRRPARRDAAVRSRRGRPAGAAASRPRRPGTERAGQLATEPARVGALEHEAARRRRLRTSGRVWRS